VRNSGIFATERASGAEPDATKLRGPIGPGDAEPPSRRKSSVRAVCSDAARTKRRSIRLTLLCVLFLFCILFIWSLCSCSLYVSLPYALYVVVLVFSTMSFQEVISAENDVLRYIIKDDDLAPAETIGHDRDVLSPAADDWTEGP